MDLRKTDTKCRCRRSDSVQLQKHIIIHGLCVGRSRGRSPLLSRGPTETTRFKAELVAVLIEPILERPFATFHGRGYDGAD